MRTLIITLAAICLLSCNREIPYPITNPTVPEAPPVPSNLVVAVGDGMLQLRWTIADTAAVAGYNIYQADSLAGDFQYIDSTLDRAYLDQPLQNGRPYFYRVAAFDAKNLEGHKSSAAVGVPNQYSLIINGGAESTSSRDVTLTLVAPSSTALMKLANSADLSGSAWEHYAPSRDWLLTAGAGGKTVYATIRDGDGNETIESISDDIALEIHEFDYSMQINQGADQAYSRDVELTIGAPAGTSYMKISTLPDLGGAQWQAFAASRQFHVQNQMAANRDIVAIFVTFRDEAGDSVPVIAGDSIVLVVSDPVEVFPVYQPVDEYQVVSLAWGQPITGDFQSLKLFRSRGSAAVDSIMAEFADIAQNSYDDNIGLDDLPSSVPDSVFYMLRLVTIYGDTSDSDTILAILQNTQPPAVSCFVGDVSYDSNDVGGIDLSATVRWSRSDIRDFAFYTVYENSALDSLTAAPIAYIYDSQTTETAITRINVDMADVYYYWLKVTDLGGQVSPFSAPDSTAD